MTKAEHKKWRTWFLRAAAKDVRRRDYLGAADKYHAVAFHSAVLATIELAQTNYGEVTKFCHSLERAGK